MIPLLAMDLFEALSLSHMKRTLPSKAPTSADLTVHTGSSTCAAHPLPRASTAQASVPAPELLHAALDLGT